MIKHNQNTAEETHHRKESPKVLIFLCHHNNCPKKNKHRGKRRLYKDFVIFASGEMLFQNVEKTNKQKADANTYAIPQGASLTPSESSIPASLPRIVPSDIPTPPLKQRKPHGPAYHFVYFLRDFLVSLTPRSRARRKVLLKNEQIRRNNYDVSLLNIKNK